MHGPSNRPRYGRALLRRTPTKWISLDRNSHVVLMRINSKPALYQPQTPFKGALNLFQRTPKISRSSHNSPTAPLMWPCIPFNGSLYRELKIQARKLEYNCSPTPKPREEGKPGQIDPGPYSIFLEPTVGVSYMGGGHNHGPLGSPRY